MSSDAATPGGEIFATSDFSAQAYDAERPTYPPKLLDHIVAYHDATGGQRGRVVDLGCGPGTVARTLGAFFDSVVGVDPSESMIAAAPRTYSTGTGKPVEYRVGGAEDLPLEDTSVDLIVSGTAAHWWRPEWWEDAARVVKKDGTVALFLYNGPHMSPDQPHYDALTAAFTNFTKAITPYRTAGNDIASSLYTRLARPAPNLPFSPAEHYIWHGSDEVAFAAVDLSIKNHAADPEDTEMAVCKEMNVDDVGRQLGTMAPVLRWREANKRTEGGDVVEKLQREIRAIKGWSEEKTVKIARGVGLVLVKRL